MSRPRTSRTAPNRNGNLQRRFIWKQTRTGCIFYLRGNPVPNLCGIHAGLADASFPRKVKTVPWKDGKPAKAELSDYCPK